MGIRIETLCSVTKLVIKHVYIVCVVYKTMCGVEIKTKI